MLIWMVLLMFSGVIVVEVWLLLLVGGWIGSGWSMTWMAVSFLLGVVLLRIEGVMVLIQIRRQLLEEIIPARDLLNMVFIVLGGSLLILPGYFTDLLGLSMLVPPLRWGYVLLAQALLQRVVVAMGGRGAEGDGREIIDITPPRDGDEDEA